MTALNVTGNIFPPLMVMWLWAGGLFLAGKIAMLILHRPSFLPPQHAVHF